MTRHKGGSGAIEDRSVRIKKKDEDDVARKDAKKKCQVQLKTDQYGSRRRIGTTWQRKRQEEEKEADASILGPGGNDIQLEESLCHCWFKQSSPSMKIYDENQERMFE